MQQSINSLMELHILSTKLMEMHMEDLLNSMPLNFPEMAGVLLGPITSCSKTLSVGKGELSRLLGSLRKVNISMFSTAAVDMPLFATLLALQDPKAYLAPIRSTRNQFCTQETHKLINPGKDLDIVRW